MAIANHDRLDQILDVEAYTDAPCGSLNLKKGEAEYCSHGCPTLKKRIMADEDTTVPCNTWPPDPVIV